MASDGSLYELQSGGSLSLANNPSGAASVVNEALSEITSLRGRLGAFQSTTLQTNINTLQSTLSNLTSAQSNIQDADFAVETANLTRAQILVQSSTQVLQIANSNPQNVSEAAPERLSRLRRLKAARYLPPPAPPLFRAGLAVFLFR